MSAVIDDEGPLDERGATPWYVAETEPHRTGLFLKQARRLSLELHQFLFSDGLEVFPRYVFVQTWLTPESWQTVATCPGFLRFLGSAPQRPQPLRPGAMAQLKLDLWGTLREKATAPRLTPGAWVGVTKGPLKGLRGKVIREQQAKQRVEVLFQLLGEATRVKLARDHVERV